jgi:NAD(P)-dependent dehydrogenase (short-subunit alcohol dehydrogenase family)
MEIAGKRCVVTGASSGIGLAAARAFAAKGARVLAAARRTEPIEREDLAGVSAFSCDLSSRAGVDSLFERARELLGGIDIFFANAGFAYCERTDEPDWERLERIFDLNVLSPIYSFEKLRSEKGDEGFFFLTTASAMSHMALPGYAVYGATKAAAHMFGRTAAYELAKGQRIATVYPVATKTAFFDRASTGYVPWPAQEPERVAAAVVRAVERDRASVYPFGAFRLANAVFAALPHARRAYLRGQWRKTGLAEGGAR